MSTPEALRLADALDKERGESWIFSQRASAELRRLTAVEAELEQLRAKVAALHADAERYRLLRAAKLWPVPGNEYSAGLCVDLWDESGSGKQLVGEALDAAVDAARASVVSLS